MSYQWMLLRGGTTPGNDFAEVPNLSDIAEGKYTLAFNRYDSVQ